MSVASHAPDATCDGLDRLGEEQRCDLERRIAENFDSLLFHREGYEAADVSPDVVQRLAASIEARAYAYACRASQAGCHPTAIMRMYTREAAALLLSEADSFCTPMGGVSGRGGSTPGYMDALQMSLQGISGGLRSIQTAPNPAVQHAAAAAARRERNREAPWGWLVPGSRMLPFVVLKGAGVAIGRGSEALWAVGGSGGSPRTRLASTAERRLRDVLTRNLSFVEVPDGRVSRLHCVVTVEAAAASPSYSPGGMGVRLEDCSSNGTFLNGQKLGRGESAVLQDGDRISLVLSVAPMAEQFFTFRCGDPRDPNVAAAAGETNSWMGDTVGSSATVYSPGEAARADMPSGILRTATSRYTTAEQSTLEDFKCQICLNTLQRCVALEPCGHNFCATCLSHHLGSQLQSGSQLSCPFRCPPPQRIIINYAVRALVELLSTRQQQPQQDPPLGRRAASISSAAASAIAHVAGSAAPGAEASAGSSSAAAAAPARSASAAQGSSSLAPQPQPPQRQQQQQHAAGSPAQREASSSSSSQRLTSALSRQTSEAVAAAAAGGPLGSGSLGSMPLGSGAGGHSRGQTPGQSPGRGLFRVESMDDDYYAMTMSLLCPLDDEHLPLEASNLKAKQVEVALAQLHDEGASAPAHQVSLEALARLAWSDDDVRESIVSGGGVRDIVASMRAHADSDGIQCNACLALMSLVRGEGEVCQSNQWHIAKAGAVEVVAAAMRHFRHSPMVTLSVLLAYIPLALENAMMQAHITQEALPDIVAALKLHPGELDIQTKGLVLLGVLIQGEDAVHDSIRIRQLEEGVTARVVAALNTYGDHSDDVLWAALFVLACLVRDGSAVFGRTAAAAARAGLLRALREKVAAYRARHEAAADETDDMIVTAGEYLVRALEPMAALQRRSAMSMAVATVGVGSAAVLLWQRYGSQDNSSQDGSSSSSSQQGGGGGLASRALATIWRHHEGVLGASLAAMSLVRLCQASRTLFGSFYF